MTTNYIKLNELVGKIKRAYLYAQTNSTKAVLEDILPELKEGKDEKIRKAIRDWIYTRPTQFFDGGFSKEEMLAWLEKQNSQILANSAKTGKVEPKFHEGDWIISNDKKSTYQVIEVKRGIYVIRDNVDNHEYYIGIEACERSGRLWTIEDAKDGDVLYSPCCKLLWIYKDDNSCYVGNNLSYNENCVVVNSSICIPSDVCPASKEQRDTLMKAMTDAGWGFDFEKKEMKKIGQKHIEWSAEDERSIRDSIFILKVPKSILKRMMILYGMKNGLVCALNGLNLYTKGCNLRTLGCRVMNK